MPVQFEVILSERSAELKRQMTHILALRRAICLLNAKRRGPSAPRRRVHRAFDRSVIVRFASRRTSLSRR